MELSYPSRKDRVPAPKKVGKMRILVAIDSSHFADGILNEIAKRDWNVGTEIRLITSTETTGHADADDQYLNQCQIILDGRTKRLSTRLHRGVKIIGELIEGNASSVINKTAKDWRADLIVIGSHGDTGIRKSGIGSVAAAVVNGAPCSVEVVKLPRHHRHKRTTPTSAQTGS